MKDTIIEILKNEVRPAMGCTEPVAITLCSAIAREYAKEASIKTFKLSLSPNLYKNALGVGIPKSDVIGLDIATAIGLIGGKSEFGLRIYESVLDSDIESAKELLKNTPHTVEIIDSPEKVYISVEIQTSNGVYKSIIKDKHNKLYKVEKDGEVLFIDESKENGSMDLSAFYSLKVEEIIALVDSYDTDDFKFLLDGLEMNMAISEEGLKKPLGAKIGYSIKSNIEKGLLSEDLPTMAMYMTAAASDARMSGITMPVMSSNGSGNNGLTAILPIAAYSKAKEVSEDKLIKALAISHLINCYIKNKIGRLSALCSCGISAATSASVAITYLEGGSSDQIKGTVNNMIGNLSGMICDGAKDGCAMKLATAAATAVHSSMLALCGANLRERNGIIGRTIEESIENLGVLSSEGMKQTDSVILSIMMDMDDTVS